MLCSKHAFNLAKVLLVNNGRSMRCFTHLSGVNNICNSSNLKIAQEKKVPLIESVRSYAKGKDKKKEKGKAKVQINENQMNELVSVESYKNNLQKAVDLLKEDFAKNLSLRSTTGSIESIVVNVDGTDHTLQELAQIIRKNPKTIVINMSVFPQVIPAALKAIQASGMNLNPQQEGTTLYIPVPKVTKEHRENLSKNAKVLFNKCKDHIKDIQNKQIKNIKKKDSVSEDLVRSVEQQLLTLANSYISEAEKVLDSKQEELVGKE